MDDHQLPHNLESLLPGMSRNFRTYVDVLPENEEPRHPGEDPLVRDSRASYFEFDRKRGEAVIMLITTKH